MTQRYRPPFQGAILIFFVVITLLVCVAVGSTILHRRAMRQLVGERNQKTAQAITTTILSALETRTIVLESVAEQFHEEGQHHLQSPKFMSLFDAGVVFFNPTGDVMMSYGDEADDVLLVEFLTQETVQASPQVIFIDGMPLIVLTAQTNDVLVVGGFEPIPLIATALHPLQDESEAIAAFIITDDKQILYQIGSLPGHDTALSHHAGVAHALQGETGLTYFDSGNSEHVVAYTPIPVLESALIIEEPWGAVVNPSLLATELAPLILVPALLFAYWLLWLNVRQVVQPLHILRQKATQLAWGDFAVIHQPVGGIAEIQRLQQELILMADKLATAQQGLRHYLRAITTGQEEERLRLARELHDDTIQTLVALNQRLQLAQLATNPPETETSLLEMEKMATQLISDLRRMTRDLRPIYLEELGLVPALEMLSQQDDENFIQFKVSGHERRLAPLVELALYRMTQEALNNIRQHAQATQAWVTLVFSSSEVTVTIEDDGEGFVLPDSPSAFATEEHFGLLGLYERAELIGAKLVITTAPQEGTQIQITVS